MSGLLSVSVSRPCDRALWSSDEALYTISCDSHSGSMISPLFSTLVSSGERFFDHWHHFSEISDNVSVGGTDKSR
jgi:hypothetical protein